MEVLCIVKEVKSIGQFTSRTGKEVKVAEVVLKSGNDEFIVSAFEDVATLFESAEITRGLYRANLLFQIQSGNNRSFQSCTVHQISKVYDGTAF